MFQINATHIKFVRIYNKEIFPDAFMSNKMIMIAHQNYWLNEHMKNHRLARPNPNFRRQTCQTNAYHPRQICLQRKGKELTLWGDEKTTKRLEENGRERGVVLVGFEAVREAMGDRLLFDLFYENGLLVNRVVCAP